MVRGLKEAHELAQNTRQCYMSRLNGFLVWAEVGMAKDEPLWKIGAGKAIHRRWLTREQVDSLMSVAKARERIVITLEAWNGLRNIEVSRLRWRDVNMARDAATLHVTGKGKNGGKERTIPMNPMVWDVLLPYSVGKRGTDPVFPGTPSAIDKDIRRCGRRAGIPVVSGHDLRRSWGRIAYYNAHVPIMAIRDIYGHKSVELTGHYIGVVESEMRAGIDAFAAAWKTSLPEKTPG